MSRLELRELHQPRVWEVLERGTIVGWAAAVTVDGERQITYGFHAADHDEALGSELLAHLVAQEPERPLYARIPPEDAASAAVLARVGFTELSRDAEVVYVLPPTLE
jgi:L-amino acid N-acyltransferase YncA